MIGLSTLQGAGALLAACLLLPLSVYGLRRRTTAAGRAFAALMISLGAWAAAAGLAQLSGSDGGWIFEILIAGGMATGPTLWFIFILSFAGHAAWLTTPRLALLWLPPLLFFGLAITNPWHQLVWSDVHLHLSDAAAPHNVTHAPALAAWVYGFYGTALGCAGGIVLLRFARRAGRLLRAQAIVIFCAALLPLIASLLFLTGADALPGLPLTPQIFLLSALILWVGVIRFHLFGMAPVAYQLLFDHLNDAALVVDRWGNLVEANAAAKALFGLGSGPFAQPLAELIPWPELHGNLAEMPTHEFQRVDAGGGADAWYELRSTPLPAPRERHTGCLVLIRNISETRRAQQALQESEQLYRSVVERQGEGIALLDAAQRFVYANPAADAIYGVPTGGLLGRTPHAFVPAAQIPLLEDQIAQRRRGVTSTYELSILRTDGATRVLLVTAAPQPVGDGPGAFVIFRDITDSRSAEELSIQWRQRYELISAAAGQLVYFHDALTNTVEWGASVEQVLGYRRDELTGGIVQWANLLHPADRQRVLAEFAHATEGACEISYRLRHSHGHYLLVHAHLLPLCASAGTLLGYVGVLQDITRQHRLQQAVRSHADRLEQLQALALTFGSLRDLDGLRAAIVQGAAQLLNAATAILYELDNATQELRRVASYPVHAAQMIDLMPAYLVAREVAATYGQRSNERTAAPIAEPGVAPAHIAMPMMTGTTLRAVIVVEDNARRTSFSAEDEQLARLLANQAAVELANCHLLAAAQVRAARMLLVNDITTAVIQAMELKVVLQNVVDGLTQALRADRTRLALFDEAHQQLAVLAHHTADDIARSWATTGAVIGATLLRLVLQTRRPLYIADAVADPRTEDSRHLLARQGIATLVVIPLTAGEEVLGVIVADFVGHPQPLSDEDLRIGETLANLAAVRIQQVRLYNTLQRLSIVDDLTQVYNYRALFEIGENEFARARRMDRPLSAIFIDIDHFGDFNNRYSHSVGNQVLRAVGQRLLAITRTIDMVARFGGEEFVVLLPETDLPLATTLGYRMHHEIGNLQVATDHGPLSVTVSIGVGSRTPAMHSLQDLIDCANLGEHRAKEAGRNRVVVG